MFGGQPSITTPTPPPCDSPKVVTRKSRPKVFPIAWKIASLAVSASRLPACTPSAGKLPAGRDRQAACPPAGFQLLRAGAAEIGGDRGGTGEDWTMDVVVCP